MKLTHPVSEDTEVDTQKATECDSVADEVFRNLAILQAEQATVDSPLAPNATSSQVSPWLERTRWTSYLNGTCLRDAARLARLPDEGESALMGITLSIDRLIDAAYTSVCEDKVNFFAQKCISSFLPNKKAYSQPLMVKLQKPTYQRYKDSWKRLLCFAYRSSNACGTVRLRHRLNSRQTALLDKLVAVATSALSVNHEGECGSGRHVAKCPDPQFDDLCLDFCISLLDHELKGDIYESVVLGLLAVLGIDAACSTFLEAPNYTSKLSGFIKIGQMLVLGKAVREVECGKVDNVLDPLDDMRRRFMTVDTCTPFSWAVSLRSFGKKIWDNTTSLGYIQWSDDGQTVFYKDIELRVQAFREFITAQVNRVQSLLADLFMLASDEAREDVVPPLYLHRVRDNPTVTEVGWSFLNDDRNRDLMPCKKGWLLRRLLHTDRLRTEFTYPGYVQKIIWDKDAVRRYRKKVEAFLEGLLLLIHVTSGQPARGTEIIGIQHSNSTFHRNIFIEDGLVALVTSYHKGYTCTGSTKIIHRYLPREVSELLVYYVWIIHPFLQELDLLVPSPRRRSSSFLWPDGEGCWNSQRLSDVLKRETAAHFKAPMTIPIYRHVAIAISRRFLDGGGFKRDYDMGDRISDLQTAHTSSTAGRLYARGLEELPGHVEARRAGFRSVSREWHELLGFSSACQSRKRPFSEIVNEAGLQKRPKVVECRDVSYND